MRICAEIRIVALESRRSSHPKTPNTLRAAPLGNRFIRPTTDYGFLNCLKLSKRLTLPVAMGEKRVELTCPACRLTGEAVVDDGQSFTVEQLPSCFRITKLSDRVQGFKIGCRCGEIFDLPPPLP
jgi:hypothetical protein